MNRFFIGDEAPDKLVVFLHGFMGDHRDWLSLCERLVQKAAGVSCLLFDLPGHGSPWNVARNWEELCRVLCQEVRSVAADSYSAVGYSLGGRVLAGMIDQDPQLFAKAVFESASFGIKKAWDREERLVFDQKLLAGVIDQKQDFAQFLANWYAMPLFVGLPSSQSFTGMLQRRAEQVPVDLQKGLNLMSVALMPYLGESMKSWPGDYLYVTGIEDRKYRLVAKGLPENFRKAIIADASHNVHAMQPEVFLNTLMDHLL